MAKSTNERVQDMRARKREAGLKQLEVWVLEADLEKLRRLENRAKRHYAQWQKTQ